VYFYSDVRGIITNHWCCDWFCIAKLNFPKWHCPSATAFKSWLYYEIKQLQESKFQGLWAWILASVANCQGRYIELMLEYHRKMFFESEVQLLAPEINGWQIGSMSRLSHKKLTWRSIDSKKRGTSENFQCELENLRFIHRSGLFAWSSTNGENGFRGKMDFYFWPVEYSQIRFGGRNWRRFRGSNSA